MTRFVTLLSLLLLGTLQAEVPASSQTAARTLQNLSYSVHNQDQEIAALKQKIQNQEAIIDSMHTEVTQLIKAAKESQKNSGEKVDGRLKGMEKNLEKLVTDLKQFKKHANDSASSFSQIEKKLKEQEEISTLQAQQIKDLEAALRSLANAMQLKTSSADKKVSAASGELYKVKAGDSLEKIAKDHGTTIEAIKKENNLSKDTIFPGQKLSIP